MSSTAPRESNTFLFKLDIPTSLFFLEEANEVRSLVQTLIDQANQLPVQEDISGNRSVAEREPVNYDYKKNRWKEIEIPVQLREEVMQKLGPLLLKHAFKLMAEGDEMILTRNDDEPRNYSFYYSEKKLRRSANQ